LNVVRNAAVVKESNAQGSDPPDHLIVSTTWTYLVERKHAK